MSEFSDEVNSLFGRKLGVLITILVSIILLYSVISMVFSFWPFSSAAGVVQKVISSESIISNYQWFYDQYNAIKAQEANVLAVSKDAPERTGMIMVLNNSIAEYNSRSKQITRNLWKPTDLPYQIELGGSK